MSNAINKIKPQNDWVVIKPKSGDEKLFSGLYLPESLLKGRELIMGYIIKFGPGYPQRGDTILSNNPIVEYLPLELEEGHLAYYFNGTFAELQKSSETYHVVRYSEIILTENTIH